MSGPQCRHGAGIGLAVEPVDECPVVCLRCGHPCPYHWTACGCDECGCESLVDELGEVPRRPDAGKGVPTD